MLDAHQLNIFLVASQTLNFTQAAQRLHMSQPSVSQHIQALEKHFDTRLFIRQGRHIALSEAGKTLVPLARAFVKQSHTIDEIMSSLEGSIQGKIILGYLPALGPRVLYKHLEGFHERYPKITIQIQVCRDPIAQHLLSGGVCHFYLTDDAGEFTNRVEFAQLDEEVISLLLPQGHPWQERSSVTVSDLRGETLILPAQGSTSHLRLKRALMQQGLDLTDLDPFLTMDNQDGIRQAVTAGLGVGFGTVSDNHPSDRVHIQPMEDLHLTRKIYLIRDKDLPLTAARQALWQHLTDANDN